MKEKENFYYPSEEFKKRALINKKDVYAQAAKNPVKFWEKMAKELFWFKKWKKGFVHNPPYFQWFSGGRINITSNIFENNSLGFERIKNKVALIWEPENEEEKEKKLTYYDLFREICRFSNALKKLGVKKGDRVGIYLPMIPEATVAMLACARLGAVHSVVFSAFSPRSLQVRLQDNEAKVLITADGYYRRGQIVDLKKNADQALDQTKVEKLIVVKRAKNKIAWQEGRDVWYEDITKDEEDFCPAEEMDSEDMHFILYTSGSTGKPKGCVHTCGGYAVQAYYTAKWIFDLKEDDIFWSTADLGWITGHTYSCYGPLLCGVSFIMFEGAPDFPVPDRWVRIIEKYGVTTFYTAPTAIRMFEQMGAEKFLNDKRMKTLQILGSVGEPIDEAAWQWYFKEVGREKCPLVDTWWQTETGGILITALPGIGPFKPAFAGLPFPGIKAEILDEQGKPCPPDKQGNLVLLPPFSPSLLRGIYKNDEKYKETYWSRYGDKIYFTSDSAYKDKEGLIRIVGRVDDVIKVAGHRVSTGELEAAINAHQEITECAVIGVADKIKGEVPAAFVVYNGSLLPQDIKDQIIAQIKKEIGPIALPKEVYLVKDLPKTRSGKIMRRILKKLLTGEDLGDLSTLSNPEVVEGIKKIIGSDNSDG